MDVETRGEMVSVSFGGSWTQFQLRGGGAVRGLPNTTKQFLDTSRGPRIQLNSDTMYPEVVSESTGLKS